jgi:hypothetical protein
MFFLLSWELGSFIYPVRKAPLALLDVKYLRGEEARGKIKDSYTFSHGINAPYESLLTGFNLSIE